LQTSNTEEVGRILNRPSPSDSATAFPVGHKRKGNDGRIWKVTVNSNGTHRWVPTTSLPSKLNYKFKIGDTVKVIKGGCGVGPEEVGTEVSIVKLGVYGSTTIPGYEVCPPIGNSDPKCSSYNFYQGMIGEESFELVDEFQSGINQIIKQHITTKPRNMAKVKSITKRTTQEVRNIETSLINKEEVFKMLALAEATGLPLLLVGEPGVAKTKTVIEYAKAWLNKDGKMTAEDFANKIYVLETDEGTKASEIKGIPDLGKLFTDNKYELNTPIADAEIVVINEVDKASSAIRNAMLGVMNEKFLFNGKHKIPCKWKLFVATCNEIPKEEVGSPFWDRFMLKLKVNRVTAGELVKYYEKGAREYREKFAIGIPSKTELASLEVPVKKMEKYLEVGYQSSSDRTLTFVPGLTKAVSYIWDISIDKALVKTAQIMIGQTAGSELQNKLMSPEVKAVMSKVEMLRSHNTNEALELAVAEVESLINAYASRGMMDQGQVEEIELSMQYILESHPARVDYQSSEEFDAMIEETAPMTDEHPF
jgi:MoxR-like ATPase/ribosomal protein S20